MKKREIENKLNKIVSNNVPNRYKDILTQIKIEDINSIKREGEFMKEGKKKFIFPKYALALSVLVICILGSLTFKNYSNNKIDSIIEFDVNPSIEVATNKKEKVIKVKPLNEDGKKVLEDMKLENVDLNIAVNAIIGSMLKNGYITEAKNAILVSVQNDNSKKAKELEEKISKEIDSVIKISNFESNVLTQSYDSDTKTQDLAKKYNISDGKVILINKILKEGIKDSKGNPYEFSSLAKLSITELELLLKSKNTTVNNVTTTGKTSDKSLIGKDKAKKIAFEKAKISASKAFDIEIELDVEKGILVYEVDFQVGKMEYEYEINAKTGEVIFSKVEIDD